MNSLNPYAAQSGGAPGLGSNLQQLLQTPPQGRMMQQGYPGNSQFGRMGGNGVGSGGRMMQGGQQNPYQLPWMPQGQPQQQRMGAPGGPMRQQMPQMPRMPGPSGAGMYNPYSQR